MSKLQSLEKVRQLLRRRGLPRVYVERVIKEFDDHRVDIVEEQRLQGRTRQRAESAADSRLGDPYRLAETVVAQYQARSFFGRHPVITFLVGPFPLVIAAWVAFAAASFALLYMVGMFFGSVSGSTIAEMDGVMLWTVLTLHYASSVVPWAAAALVLCALARYSGRGIGWLVAGCALTTIFALALRSEMTLPVEPGTGRYTIAVGLGLSRTLFQLSHHLLQVIVPFGVFALFLAQSQYRRWTAETA